MSDLFSIYREQFETVTNRLNKLVENLTCFYSAIFDQALESNYKKVSDDFDKNLKEAERIAKQMELDINLNAAGTMGSGLGKKNVLLKCKGLLEDMKMRFKKAKENYESKKKEKELTNIVSIPNVSVKNPTLKQFDNRQPLIGSNFEDNSNNKSNDQITLLSLESRSSEKLNHVKRTGIELSNLSEGIMRDLNKQSDDLLDIRTKVGNINGSLDNSNSLIRSMITTGQKNKYVLGVFSVALVCMFVLIVYSRV